MSAAPLGHIVMAHRPTVIGVFSSCENKRLQPLSASWEISSVGCSHWTWLSGHHGSYFPSAGRAGSTNTTHSLGYAMFPFMCCTTCPQEFSSMFLIMAGRVTNCIGTPVLCALSFLSGHLVGAPPGLEPSMCAQQWPSHCAPGAWISWD